MKTICSRWKGLCLILFCLLLMPLKTEANSILTAQNISTSTAVSGVLTSSEKFYYFKVSVPSDGYLQILNFTSGMKRFGFGVYNSSKRMVGYKTLYTANGVAGKGSYQVRVSKGTYYIRIIGNTGNAANGYYTGRYSFSTRFVGDSSVDSNTGTSTSGITVKAISVQTYTGKRLRPSVTVKDGNKVMVEGTDYTLTYKNNRYPGRASVTIKGIGNYQGKKTVYFFIRPAKVKVTSLKNTAGRIVTLQYKKYKKITGYQIYYSTSRNSGYRLLDTRAKTKCVVRFKSLRTYYFKVRAYKELDNVTLYGKFCSPKGVRVYR